MSGFYGKWNLKFVLWIPIASFLEEKMYFSSMTFLWLFLPATIFLYCVTRRFENKFPHLGNIVLLAASLIFYAWGEPVYIFLLIFSVIMNYMFGLLLGEETSPRFLLALGRKKAVLVCSVAFNIGMLGFFKYANFLAGMANQILGSDVIPFSPYALPLGISFYTFQAMSYVIDVYRKEVKAQRNFFSLLLYISLFPQLVAGPIVKYKDIERQILHRENTPEGRSYGVKRFVYGLGKKVLLSNVLGKYADFILSLPADKLGTDLAWLAMILYAFQIYYDFSGYSDMAIGLGSMFGFQFKENFNYPYMAKSIQEFWRRWHISLSTWFREYVYIPLGGNRKGGIRTYRNLFVVFFLTGLWHGASWNFVLWGLFHGFFMIVERLGFGKILEKNPVKILNHAYVAVVFVCGWVFFRIEDIGGAMRLLKTMFIYQKGEYHVFSCLNGEVALAIAAGFLLCGVLQAAFPKLKDMLYEREEHSLLQTACLGAVLFLCVVSLSADAYNPFIYFRF